MPAPRKAFQAEDKRRTIFMTLSDYTEVLDYPAGDILYTALRVIARERGGSVSFLRGMTDNELYRGIEKALRAEIED